MTYTSLIFGQQSSGWSSDDLAFCMVSPNTSYLGSLRR